jgi:hypothetical protein
LIYAAIVAAWAAVLVPRWVRRNEEVDQAHEADLARGVRVLGPADSLTPSARTQARHASVAVDTAEPAVVTVNERGVELSTDYGRAARRRRRVLAVLVIALVGVTVAAVVGRVPLWSVAVPTLVLGVFVRLARRAAAAEANSRARRRRRLEPTGAAVIASPRIAALDEPAPSKPAAPDEWEPVPVPLPTYLTKPKAPQLATRSIDLSHPGAWTSGRPEPAESIPMPRPIAIPEAVGENVDDLPEHRPAVGD